MQRPMHINSLKASAMKRLTAAALYGLLLTPVHAQVEETVSEPELEQASPLGEESEVPAEPAETLAPEAAHTEVAAEEEAGEADLQELPKARNVPLNEPITVTPREEPATLKDQESARDLVLLG
ncbi:MAG: hypothetical protein ACNA7T_14050, partial [Haliea sp.]